MTEKEFKELKPGDKVKIVSKKTKGKDGSGYWDNLGIMDKWLGRVMTVKSIAISDSLNMIFAEMYESSDPNCTYVWYPWMIECKVTEHDNEQEEDKMSKSAVRLNYEKKKDIEQITKIIREFNAEKRRYSTKTDPDDDEELAERLVNSGIGNVDRYLEDFHNEIERNEQFAKDMGFTPEVTPQYIAKEYKRRAEKYKDALNEMADFVADQLVSHNKNLAIRLLTKVLSDSFLEKAIKEEQADEG